MERWSGGVMDGWPKSAMFLKLILQVVLIWYLKCVTFSPRFLYQGKRRWYSSPAFWVPPLLRNALNALHTVDGSEIRPTSWKDNLLSCLKIIQSPHFSRQRQAIQIVGVWRKRGQPVMYVTHLAAVEKLRDSSDGWWEGYLKISRFYIHEKNIRTYIVFLYQNIHISSNHSWFIWGDSLGSTSLVHIFKMDLGTSWKSPTKSIQVRGTPSKVCQANRFPSWNPTTIWRKDPGVLA